MPNWYRNLKLAQVWNVESDGEFSSEVKRVYELEYKRFLIRNNPFRGNPQRQANILAQIEKNLQDALNNVKSKLETTFESWLESHALTDPERWTAARMSDRIDDNPLDGAVIEYSNYLTHGYSGNKPFTKMLNEASRDLSRFPSFKKLQEYIGYTESRREIMHEELSSYGFEEFGEIHGQQFADENAATEWIESRGTEDIEFDPSEYYAEYDKFKEDCEYAGVLNEVAQEFYTNLVFPVWYAKWSAEGIDETRETVQKVYDMLMSARTLDEQCAAVNIALNTSHQTGSMLDYLPGDIADVFESLTNGEHNTEWESQVQAIGTQLPQQLDRPYLPRTLPRTEPSYPPGQTVQPADSFTDEDQKLLDKLQPA